MAIKRTKLGPGLLTIGETASAQEFGVQLSSCAVEPSEDEGDTVNVLSGDSDVDDGEFTGTLTGSLWQDYETDSLIKWSWDHHGEILPFTFHPSEEAALQVSGTVRIARLKIGGDVKSYNASDISWNLPAVPTLTDTTP